MRCAAPLARTVELAGQAGGRFFTNVADHLLQSQLGMNLAQIQVHPTNQYGPAVHRMLQVAANLLDATTNTPFPSVFRPQFGPHPTIPGGVVITGYAPDADAATAAPNPYGIPYVIGAKKGLPNFNEFVLQTMVQAVRKVEVRRPALNQPPHLTNELFFLAMTNFVGVEFWNSYSSN